MEPDKVVIIIQNSLGQLFVHQRSADRETFPLLYGLGAGGHVEPKEKLLMTETPKNIKKEGILGGFTKFLILTVSLATGILSLLLFWHLGIREGNLNLGRTIAFATIASVSLIYIFAYKNLKKPIIKTENFFQNKFMFLGVAYGFLLLFLAIYLPFLNKFLGTIPLEPFHWLLIFAVTLFITLMVELVKIFPEIAKQFKKIISSRVE